MAWTTERQEMLMLAALTYRGFADVLPGEPHEMVVRQAVQRGLRTLLGDRWTLAWGPVTSRIPLGSFDSCAMFVVRNAIDPSQLVVAIRGTNPISAPDWLFGDLLVGTMQDWPSTPGAAISTSTAVGLSTLQEMRDRPPSAVARLAATLAKDAGDFLDPVVLDARAILTASSSGDTTDTAAVLEQADRVVQRWVQLAQDHAKAVAALQNQDHSFPGNLLPRWTPNATNDGVDLLTFLHDEAEKAPLDVVVTGHSKGGALAPTVAQWLAETRVDPTAPSAMGWARPERATIRCCAFAGPTPGNKRFAELVDETLGTNFDRVANYYDLVPTAWSNDGIRSMPQLYGNESAVFWPLVDALGPGLARLGYTHPAATTPPFKPADVDLRRPLPFQMIHQHMDAYLIEAGLAPGVTAVDFFVG